MSTENGDGSTTTEALLRRRLNDPDTVESLLQILDKLDVIALTVTSIDGFLQRGDVIMDNVSDGVEELRAASAASEVDWAETAGAMAHSLPDLAVALPQLTASLPRLVALVEQLNDPETAAALDTIVEKAGLVAFALDSVDGFLQRGDEIIENVADGVREINQLGAESGVELGAMLGQLAVALPELTKTLPVLSATLPTLVQILPQLSQMLPTLMQVAGQLQVIFDSEEFHILMDSSIFAPKTVGIVNDVGNAFVESYEANLTEPQQLGIFGLMRALSNKDVQRTLGFAVEFARRYGQQISDETR